MEIVYDLLVVLHFIGLAALLGGWLVQISASPRVVNRAMLDGAFTQLVTGLALVGVAEAALDRELDHTKVGIKLLILLIITTLVWVNRKKAALGTGTWLAIGLLTITNIVIAVFV